MNNKTAKVAICLAVLLPCHLYAKEAITQYGRSLYGGWIDIDKDCQNTRQEVLIEESVIPVVLDETGCKVISGKWYDPYTDEYYYDPKVLDIDHMVPLKEAHISGAYSWNEEEKIRYANDLNDKKTLIAVYRGANRSKGAKDPAQWLPSNTKYHCQYILNWELIKKNWGLSVNKQEYRKIQEIKKRC